MAIAFNQRSVHKSAGIPFIRVADNIFLITRCVPALSPLAAGGKTAAAAPSQAGVLDFLDNRFRREVRQGGGQCRISADGDIIFDGAGIYPAVLSEQLTILGLVERDLRFGPDLLP